MSGNRNPRRPRLRVGAKFFLVLVLLVTCLLVSAIVGLSAQARMKAEAGELYAENLLSMQRLATVSSTLTQTGWTALQIIPTTDLAHLAELRSHLHDRLVPQADRQILAVQDTIDEDDELAAVNRMSTAWQRFKALLTSPGFLATTNGPTDAAANDELADEVVAALSAVEVTVVAIQTVMADEARARYTEIGDEYEQTQRNLAIIIAAALLAGVGSVAWLIHDVVPRIRRYSSFAADVAAGELSVRLSPSGSDELSDLGRTLNQMVDRRAAERDYEASQSEFGRALQITANEEEAHYLLKRHLERSIAGATTVVLSRNNSADRLQPATALPADGVLATRLSGAQPQACLAVRFARPNEETAGAEGLMRCAVCGLSDTSSRCEPLLVGGEVIGSVLVQCPELSGEDQRRLTESVMQAAPVLANLRNLALAEHRALTDALTGLPNQRASHDTLLRMVAQASRTVSPLAALLIDLDHFKQVNDVYGHDKGDAVLAAVGTMLSSSLRASDFAGRYGGEEFILLLPDTHASEAVAVAEFLRTAMSAITIPGVDRAITSSFGIAALPDHAPDAATLVRQADRALYAAKSAGRDRVEVVAETGDAARPSRHSQPGDDTDRGPSPLSPDQDRLQPTGDRWDLS